MVFILVIVVLGEFSQYVEMFTKLIIIYYVYYTKLVNLETKWSQKYVQYSMVLNM